MAKKPSAPRPAAPAVMSPAPQPTLPPAPQPALPPSTLPPMLHQRWIRFLVIAGHSNAHIRQLLENDDLPCPSDAVLDAVRTQHTPPAGFQPQNRAHGPSLRFVLGAQVEPLFRRDQRDAAAVLELLRNPRARELVEAATIVDVPVDVVVPMLSSLVSVTTSAAAVSLFASTFFDTDVVAKGQLGLLVRERVKMLAVRAAGGAEDQNALRRAVAADARTLALALPRSQLAWHSVLMSLGWMPPRRELGAALGELEQLATLRAGQALMRGGRDDDRRADGFVTVVGKLRAIKENLADPNASAMKALQQIRITQATTKMPSVRQLVEAGDQVGTLEIGPATAVEKPEEEPCGA